MRIKRIFANGQSREVTMQARVFNDLIRQAMPLAKLRNDTNKYSDVSFTPEAGGVRIKSKHYSNLKKYGSPHELLIKSRTPPADG
jgi:hypothetical protein